MFQILRTCKYEHIENFVVYGERHSGTTFLESCLSCYDINQTGFFGHKHWMGFAKPEKIEYTHHILFACIVRNPYQWLMSFFDLPHHVPLYKRANFESFILDEWYSLNNSNQEILEDKNILDSQKRYKNIFEMRETKNIYMLSEISNLARNFIFLRYEDLCYNHENIMNTIQYRFRLKLKKELPKPKPIKYREIIPEYKSIIDDNLNWETENSMGYFKS